MSEVLRLRVSSKRRVEMWRRLRDKSKCTQQDMRGEEGGSPQETEEGRLLGAERELLKFKNISQLLEEPIFKLLINASYFDI